MPRKDCTLPSWMASKSVRRSHQGVYAENTTMPCLQAKYKLLSRNVPEVKPEDMVHVVGGIYCPISVLFGRPSVHTSNGVFAARENPETEECGVVYASCPKCLFDKSLIEKGKGKGKEAQLVEIVPGTEDYQNPWVAYTSENYTRIAEAAEKNRTHPAKHTAKTSKKAKAEGWEEEGTA